MPASEPSGAKIGDAAHRCADDRRDGLVDLAHPRRHPAIYALLKGWRLPSNVAATSDSASAPEPGMLGVAAE
jgi:hypothetical protein